jgi:methylmalonyl-CoA mutase cobalamin-binding subunit
VLAGDGRPSDEGTQALTRSLTEAGVEISYIGREHNARRIAVAAADAEADAVEVCVAGGGSVVLVRELLRELKSMDGGGISIVVHRVN